MAPSIRAASSVERGIPCSPASTTSATKGVVFHTSATTIAAMAVPGRPSHATGPCRRPALVRRSFSTPNESLKIQPQARAMTAVGSAHGTSTMARAQRRPGKD